MPLSLALDYAAQVVDEPGYYRVLDSAVWKEVLNAATPEGNRDFWADKATGTLMLKPLQYLGGWLNSSAQLDSIVGLVDRGSGKLVVDTTNTANFRVFEANRFQNPDNPWVFHSVINAGTLLNLQNQLGILALEQRLGAPISTTDTRVIAYTEEKLQGNQAMYLRWHQPHPQVAGGLFTQGFTIGQYVLVFQQNRLQVLRDISESKDRTAFQQVGYYDLFGRPSPVPGDNANSNRTDTYIPDEQGPVDRSILWVPLRRNLIYIESNVGNWAIIDSREPARLNGKTGDDLDWDIVDDKELLVWGYSPAVGCFQVQKVKWAGPAGKDVRMPTFTLDYSPTLALGSANLHLDADTYRGTEITIGAVTTPPGYDDPVNTLYDCPEPTTDATDVTRKYGATLTFTSSSDQRFTSMLYNISVRVDRSVSTWAVPSVSVGDTAASASRIRSARLSSSLKPGDSRLDVEVDDTSPFALATRYYRSSYPVRLTDGLTVLFTGITDPTEVTPMHFATNRPRRLQIQAVDYWKLLDTPVRDLRDWSGTGHMTVVSSLVQQQGIDITGADFPTPTAAWNTPLGGVNPSIMQSGALKKPVWRAGDTETVAEFIKRIAEKYAGFVVGFYPDGTFYYLPSAQVWFYNSSEATFFKSHQVNPAGPCYEDPVAFETMEPEANVVRVKGRDKLDRILYSAERIDWASILNPAVPNFIGRRRFQPYFIDGQLTCEEINRIALVIWRQTRKRQLKVRFTGEFVPGLRVGRVFTLEGQAGTWRLLSYCSGVYPRRIQES